jgi:hypothetical protein
VADRVGEAAAPLSYLNPVVWFGPRGIPARRRSTRGMGLPSSGRIDALGPPEGVRCDFGYDHGGSRPGVPGEAGSRMERSIGQGWGWAAWTLLGTAS